MTKAIQVNGDTFVPMISERRIRARIRELAQQISDDHRGTVPVFIGILNGSFIFFADLIREVSIPCEVDFLKLSSYGDAKISSGNVRLLKDLNCQVEGRNIVVVEDVIDSGLSMEYIKALIQHQNPKSLKVVTLLYKKEAVTTAYRHASRGDVVLLSPGCASFDEFANYKERGNVFQELVGRLER